MVDRAPKVVRFAVNLHEDFVQMPLPIRITAHLVATADPDPSSKYRAKSIPPVSHRFAADIDPTLVQQVFDVSERKWKATIHRDRQATDLRAGVKVLEGVFFDMSKGYETALPASTKFVLTMPTGVPNTQISTSLGRAIDSLLTRLVPFCAFLIMPL